MAVMPVSLSAAFVEAGGDIYELNAHGGIGKSRKSSIPLEESI
jgi:hypothetical protein